MSQILALLVAFMAAGYFLGKRKGREVEYTLRAIPVAVLAYFGIFMLMGSLA